MEGLIADVIEFCKGCSDDPHSHFLTKQDGVMAEIFWCRKLSIIAVRPIDSPNWQLLTGWPAERVTLIAEEVETRKMFDPSKEKGSA